MSKTDGIGTWLWNDVPNLAGQPSQQRFSFLFSADGSDFATCEVTSSRIAYISVDGVDYVIAFSKLGGWQGDVYKTIDIKTAPPAEFLTILQANATYQEPKLTDLTGTTWKWNNEIPVDFPDVVSYNVNFNSNNTAYSVLEFDGRTINYSNATEYVSPYDVGLGWEVNFQLISITGGTDATNTDLINYLYANAELQGSAPVEKVYKLRSNGTYFRGNGKLKGVMTYKYKDASRQWVTETYKYDNTDVVTPPS